jgi:hypothetical protein
MSEFVDQKYEREMKNNAAGTLKIASSYNNQQKWPILNV